MLFAGDDEHSDFFHEAGELAGGSSWWEEQDGGRLSGYPSVEAIFKGSFNHMSEDAKCNFKARLNLLSRVNDQCVECSEFRNSQTTMYTNTIAYITNVNIR